MGTAVTGLLRGATITLDEEVPPLDGRRVRVFVEAEEPAQAANENDNRRLWMAWVTKGPQGPLDLGPDDAFPDEP